ncbi:hypothetical protein [Streptomyces sp. NPDC046925]|uniref:hypothetical protein n=1 Tax=Streptomyces sp. NPDC046925 TaxID=3155375 RepID=UPI0033FDB009
MFTSPARAGEVAGHLLLTWPGGQETRTDVNYACYEVQPAGNTTISNGLVRAKITVWKGPDCYGGYYDKEVHRDETHTYPHAASYQVLPSR